MKTLKEKIEVMQAALDGKEIETKVYGGWDDQPSPEFNWIDFDYRIKPEPIEFWVNIYRDCRCGDYKTKADALEKASPDVQNTIKVREVTE